MTLAPLVTVWLWGCARITGVSCARVARATVLSAGAWSVAVELTLTTLVIRPATAGLTTRLAVAAAPDAKVPSAHVTVPLWFEQLPWLGAVLTKVTPAASESTRVTLLAGDGPRLVIKIE